MDNYKIGNKEVGISEWRRFGAFLEHRIGPEDSARILHDKVVNEDEVVFFIDANHNKKVDPVDFATGGIRFFKDADYILKRYGFDVYQQFSAVDYNSDINIADIPDFFWSDKDFVLSAAKGTASVLQHAGMFKNDRGFIGNLVSQQGLALEGAGIFRGDRKIVLKAVEQNGLALEYAAEPYKKDPEIVLTAVKQNKEALKYADISLRKDAEFMLSAMADFRDGALKYADENLLESRKFAFEAVRLPGYALKYLSFFKGDRDVVLAAIRSISSSLKYADVSLQNDREFLIEAIKQKPSVLLSINDKFKKDRSFLAEALKENGRALKFIDDDFQRDVELLGIAVRKDYHRLEKVKSPLKECAWETYIREIEADWKGLFSNQEMQSTSSLFAALKSKYDIEFPERFRSVSTILEAVKNRHGFGTSYSKHAILIYNKDDWNGAFEQYPVADRLRELGYQVAYYETDRESKVKGFLDETTKQGKYPVDLIVLGGHGTSTSLQLGSADDDESYIEVNDFKTADEFDLKKYVKRDGDIILDSCSTGKGGKGDPNNLANTVAKALFPETAVHSAKIPINIRRININNVSGRIEVEWSEPDSYYIAQNNWPMP